MANIYVSHLGSNTAPYGSWATAATQMSSAITQSVAGDDIWVASDHVETTSAGLALVFKGTSTSPNRVVSVNKAGSAPPVSGDVQAGASIATVGTNALTICGHAFIEGVSFSSGTGAVAVAFTLIGDIDSWLYLKNCVLSASATGGGSITFGGATSGKYRKLILDNTPVNFSSTLNSMHLRSIYFVWKNTTNALTGTLPSTIFTSTVISHADINNVDLSAAGAGVTLFSGAQQSRYFLTNCKLNPSVTLYSSLTFRASAEIYLFGTSGDNINYNLAKYNYLGSQVPDVIYTKVGGASDGTTSYSHKIVTSARTKNYDTFDALSNAVWVDSIGSPVTVTVDGIWSSVGSVLPTQGDIWCDVQYLGDATSTLGSSTNDGPTNILDTATTAQGVSSATWVGGLVDETKFSLSCTFTPYKKGFIQLVVKVAKPSATFYLDPMVTVS